MAQLRNDIVGTLPIHTVNWLPMRFAAPGLI
jgi:hypothetical protein